MQDYSYIQYAIIEKVFKCHMTILGDRHQTIGDGQVDVTAYIREIFGTEVKLVEMKKSYRQTVEIGKFAADIIGEKDIEFFERHGKEPEMKKCVDDTEMYTAMAKVLKEQFEQEKYETAAVLCFSAGEAESVYKKLKETLNGFPDIVHMDKETERFKKGITVTTFYMAKGLEFDCVHVPYCDERYGKDGFGKQAMYVSATRAMHELNMYSV